MTDTNKNIVACAINGEATYDVLKEGGFSDETILEAAISLGEHDDEGEPVYPARVCEIMFAAKSAIIRDREVAAGVARGEPLVTAYDFVTREVEGMSETKFAAMLTKADGEHQTMLKESPEYARGWFTHFMATKMQMSVERGWAKAAVDEIAADEVKAGRRRAA